MTNNNHLIAAMVTFGLVIASVLLVTVATNLNQATPLVNECGVSTEC